MPKRALVVGINSYDHAPDLACCVDDARAIAQVLGRNADGSVNYSCKTVTSDDTTIKESDLRAGVRELFSGREGDDILFYFSGHGMISETGGNLVTQDGQVDDQGYPMSELLQVANRSNVGSVLLILDCCHSGIIGSAHTDSSQVTLAEGVTILAASAAKQESSEGVEHSLFTELVLGALEGGAADVRGRVSAASIYGYVEQALDTWKQRPMYKSHAAQLNPVRLCEPAVSDPDLRKLTQVFSAPGAELAMDPSYERTHADASADHVELFDLFKVWRNARLLQTTAGEDLYYAALQSGSVKLTRLGQFYWRQVKNNIF